MIKKLAHQSMDDMVVLFRIMFVSKKLRNFLVLNNIIFKDEKTGPNPRFRIDDSNCRLLKSRVDRKFKLLYKGQIIDIPNHVKFYVNVLITEPEIIKNKLDKNIDKAIEIIHTIVTKDYLREKN